MRKVNKNPIILSIIPVIILAGFIGFKTKRSGATVSPTSYFANNISKFCINNFCLVKEADGWSKQIYSEKQPADNELAESYAKKFAGIRLAQLISENKDKFKELGFEGSQVILKVGSKELEIGNIDKQYDGTYVKPRDENKVYLISSIFDKVNLDNPKIWDVKFLTNLPLYQISKITVSHNKQSREFLPKDNKWDNQKFIDKIVQLPVGGFLRNVSPDENIYEYTVESQGEKTEFKIGKSIKDGQKYTYWASRDRKNYFEINKDDFDLLTGVVN
ncbi:MAG TPA: DUF4340 domain-containing protein [Patescibacteria group bacterium]